VVQVPVNDGDEFEIAEGILTDQSFLFLYNSLCFPGMQVEWAKTHCEGKPLAGGGNLAYGGNVTCCGVP